MLKTPKWKQTVRSTATATDVWESREKAKTLVQFRSFSFKIKRKLVSKTPRKSAEWSILDVVHAVMLLSPH